ncbi:MAG: hypothetical protein K0B52_02510 [FCB group bacterium]|nr:hypothetical protein [FCB group bacterium]
MTEDKRFDYCSDPHDSRKRSQLHMIPILWRDGSDLIPVLMPEETSGNEPKETDALVYTAGTTYEDVLTEKINTDAAPDLFEISTVIAHLDKWSPSYDKKTWSRRLGIGEEQWNDIKQLISYEPEWKRYLIQKHVPLKRVLSFASKELRKTMQPLLILNPGINVLESLAGLATGIAQRDKCTIPEVFQRCGIPSLLRDETKHSAECMRSVQQSLLRERFPAMTEFRERMDSYLKNIHTPRGIALRTDPSFEAPGFEIYLRAEKKEDIGTMIRWLHEKEEELKEIMDIQTGDNKGE